MKKLIIGTALAAAMCSSFAFSADNAAAAIQSSVPIILSDCSLLADDVTPSLSSGVSAGYNCVTADNAVVVVACHANGRVASRTIQTPCVVGANAALGQTECVNPAIAFNTATNTGAAMMRGNTSGGSIGPDPLDGTLCTVASVAGKL